MASMMDVLPALPEGMAELLEEIPLPPRRTTFADLKFLFGDAAPEEGVRYLGLGLRGSGLQGGSLEYLLDAKNLRLAVSLPWDRGYGDPEEERASVENAFQLVNLCLTFRPEEELLTLFLDADTLFWSFTKKGGNPEGGRQRGRPAGSPSDFR